MGSLLSELRAVRVLLYHFYLFGSIDTFIRATEWSLHLTGWWMNAHGLILLFRYLRPPHLPSPVVKLDQPPSHVRQQDQPHSPVVQGDQHPNSQPGVSKPLLAPPCDSDTNPSQPPQMSKLQLAPPCDQYPNPGQSPMMSKPQLAPPSDQYPNRSMMLTRPPIRNKQTLPHSRPHPLRTQGTSRPGPPITSKQISVHRVPPLSTRPWAKAARPIGTRTPRPP